MAKRKRGGSRPPAAAPTRTPPRPAAEQRTAPTRWSVPDRWPVWQRWPVWLAGAAVLLLASVLALQPISSDELWWQLSRGRQVLSTGTLWPSIELLAHETRGEANALGAALVAAAYQVAGASGLMLLRLLAVAAVTWWVAGRLRDLAQRRGNVAASVAAVVSALAAVALVQHFDPLPTLADALAIAVLAAHGRRSQAQPPPASAVHAAPQVAPRRRGDLILAGTFVAWANLGNLVFIGLCLLTATALIVTAQALVAPRPQFTSAVAAARRAWTAVAIALLAGCVNPIGVRLWWESFAQAVPWAVAPAWALQHTPWIALTQSPWMFPTAALVLLSVCWIARQLWLGWPAADASPWPAPRTPLEPLAQMALLQFFVWTSAAALPLGIAWIWSDWLEDTRKAAGTLRVPWPRMTKAIGRPHPLVAALLPLAVSGVLATGLASTAGWGIAARLDPRFLQLALAGTRDRGTIFADDTRSAGIAAWVAGVIPPSERQASERRANDRQVSDRRASDRRVSDRRASERSGEAASVSGSPGPAPERLQVQDEPRRALVGGRLATDQRLWKDLREGRQMRYWRADATPGGWWLALNARRTSLLAFSRRDVRLIRRLEPSIWKPLSLESPVLPYARAGDRNHSPRILEILSQRETIDQRPWDYQPPASSGSAFDRDGWGLLPRRRDPTPTLRQAEVFLAMELRIAALRVLAYGLTQKYGDGHQETDDVNLKRLWRQCQVELADQEQLLAGRPSRMRALAVAARTPEPTADPLQTATAIYCSAGPVAAMQHAQQASPLSAPLRYALLCWAVESAQYDEALQQIEALTNDPSLPAELALLTRQRRNQLRWLTTQQPTEPATPQTIQPPPEAEPNH